MKQKTASKKINLAILGGGKSGLGAALLARKRGLVPFVSDSGSLDNQIIEALDAHEIGYEQNGHSESLLLSASEVVKSPGIPDEVPLVQKLIAAKIPVISEIEFASRYTRAKLIAITGTNGKTTTSLLTYHLLKHAGLDVGLGGNVGQSFAGALVDMDHDYFVLELSSFQLDNMYQFKADIAVLLNITPDHLKRYEGNIKLYARSKFRILQNMDARGKFIFYAGDANINNYLKSFGKEIESIIPQKLPITSGNERGPFDQVPAANVDNNHIDINYSGEFRINPGDCSLTGRHNKINISAAVLCARCCDIDKQKILEGLRTFKNVPHRMEKVGAIKEVTFYNDSKATNVEAVYYALEGLGVQASIENDAKKFTKRIIWIAGGEDKGNDYIFLYPLVAKYVKKLICLGKDNKPLINAFGDYIGDIEETQNMEQAVALAMESAKKGDLVVLSPACASFDLFKNYEVRGEAFKKAVKKLQIKYTGSKKQLL